MVTIKVTNLIDFVADIFGHAEFLVPTPSYASDPSWGPLLQ